MKTAKQLLQAYIDGSALESAALFAEKGALELPYLADLGVDPRYEGPKNIGAFLTFLHEKMYPNFKFVDVKIYIDTPDQAFGEYTIHQKSGISGKDSPSALLRPLHCSQRQDRPASGSAQCTRRRRWNVPEWDRRCHQQEIVTPSLASHFVARERTHARRPNAFTLHCDCHDPRAHRESEYRGLAPPPSRCRVSALLRKRTLQREPQRPMTAARCPSMSKPSATRW